ncbi:MAG: transglycosylase SLT domain-containing protein [Casimicrobiaceae bacterium]
MMNRRHAAALTIAFAVLWTSTFRVLATAIAPEIGSLEVAALQDDPQALTALAVKYENAEGAPRDFARAQEMYCRAAKAGDADGAYGLAWMYANGRGVERDDALAGGLFRLASERGHLQAMKLLAMFRSGPGTRLPACALPDLPEISPVDRLADVVAREPPPNESAKANDEVRPRTALEKLVYDLAPRYAVDPKLAMAVIQVESASDPVAVSPKNAQGLMQLIPETAQRFGVKHVFNPVENINGGLAYLQWLLAFFQGNVELVAAAYNAGEGAVERYGGIPPYSETRRYVRKITELYASPKHPYQSGIVGPSLLVSRIKKTR